jgi:inner membrane protein
MDTLTHGLLGAAAGALPLPKKWGETSPRAALLAGIIAAELPDLDYLLPAADDVLHTLQAHRGLTHSLLAAPFIAVVAALVAKLIFREKNFLPLYLRALLAVPLAHLLPDLWTGWGTRLFLPFSGERLALDWTMVLDPYFTAPLVLAAILAVRAKKRVYYFAGLTITAAYLIVRIALAAYLKTQVEPNYPATAKIHVFPAPLAVFSWRYVAEVENSYVAGTIELGHAPAEHARVDRNTRANIPPALSAIPTVREALDWARFPVAVLSSVEDKQRVEVADLRYHLRGAATLKFVVTVKDGKVVEAHLDRGGSAKDLFQRWRKANTATSSTSQPR